MRRYLLPFFLFFVLATGVLEAQIQVSLNIKRRLYVVFEPIEATVSIRNLAGQDVTLADDGAQPWFSFTIFREDGRPIPPREGAYRLEPMVIPANGTVRRKVTLNELYPIDEFGGYRIRASIYFSPLGQFFQSKSRFVDITEGRTIWRQIVGVPQGDVVNDRREMTVMTFRQPKSNFVYVRVRDLASQAVFCTYPAGKLISSSEPQIMLDGHNHLHIMHLTGPKVYLHTEVGLNGEILTRDTYYATKYRPTLRRNSKTGGIRVAGGILDGGPIAPPSTPGGPGIPKISDRPVNIPTE